jgi:hypothetical protein
VVVCVWGGGGGGMATSGAHRKRRCKHKGRMVQQASLCKWTHKDDLHVCIILHAPNMGRAQPRLQRLSAFPSFPSCNTGAAGRSSPPNLPAARVSPRSLTCNRSWGRLSSAATTSSACASIRASTSPSPHVTCKGRPVAWITSGTTRSPKYRSPSTRLCCEAVLKQRHDTLRTTILFVARWQSQH